MTTQDPIITTIEVAIRKILVEHSEPRAFAFILVDAQGQLDFHMSPGTDWRTILQFLSASMNTRTDS